MVTGIEESGLQAEKRTDDNCHSWKFQMKMCLVAEDLWGIVAEDETLGNRPRPRMTKIVEDGKIWHSLRSACLCQQIMKFMLILQAPRRKLGLAWSNNFRRNFWQIEYSIEENCMQKC